MPSRFLSVLLVPALALMLGGCSHMERMLFTEKKVHHATSVMSYLYPEGDYQVLAATADITVPANVGIAFVPEEPGRTGAAAPLPEKEKARFMETVRQYFSKYEFVGRIEPIPTAYLRPKGGYDNLQQAANLFGVDVVVLLSYDQVQFNDPKTSSFLYWTVVGLYLVKGEQNDTQTLLDAVVIDVKSSRMLFRAPGTSRLEADATALKEEQVRREQSLSGFRIAMGDLMDNLDQELIRFRDEVKQRDDVRVTHAPGYSGGGAGGAALALLAAAVVALAGAARNRR